MFQLAPFRRRRQNNQPQENEDIFDSLAAHLFSDQVDTADIGFNADIKEDEKNYYIIAELPGFNNDEINLELKEDHLIISTDPGTIQETEKENYIRKERQTGTCQRTFKIDNVKRNDISAEYEDGLLEVQLPKNRKAETTGHRVIDIK